MDQWTKYLRHDVIFLRRQTESRLRGSFAGNYSVSDTGNCYHNQIGHNANRSYNGPQANIAASVSAFMSAALIISIAAQMTCEASPAPKKSAPAQRGSVTSKGNISGALDAYLARLRPKLVNNWILADGKNHVEIKAVMHADGSVSDVTVKSIPNNVLAEQSANEAFAAAQPFEPLPSSVATTACLSAIFDSSADPHGDSTSNISLRLDPGTSSPDKPTDKSNTTNSETDTSNPNNN